MGALVGCAGGRAMSEAICETTPLPLNKIDREWHIELRRSAFLEVTLYWPDYREDNDNKQKHNGNFVKPSVPNM